MKRFLSFYVFIFFILFFLFIWFLGGHFFHLGFTCLIHIFGEENLEGTFAPISALFSGLAAGGAIFAIIMQNLQYKRQQFENNFYAMLNIHRANRNEICIDNIKTIPDGPSAFQCYYKIFREIHLIIENSPNSGRFINLPDDLSQQINENIDQLRNDSGEILIKDKSKPRLAYTILTDLSEHALDQYFRHLYRIIKYVECNAPLFTSREYSSIIRAQLSYYEQALFYYNALFSRDLFPDGISKFQDLIERHGLLHNMQRQERELIFDNDTAGTYAPEAFEKGLPWWKKTMRHARRSKIWKFFRKK